MNESKVSEGVSPRRACHICRKRKSRCVLATVESTACQLCDFYGYECQFPQLPPKPKREHARSKPRRRTKIEEVIPGSAVLVFSESPEVDSSTELRRFLNPPAASTALTSAEPMIPMSSPAATSDDPGDPFHLWFLDNSDPFPVSPLMAGSPVGGSEVLATKYDDDVQCLPDYDCLEESKLHKTLGLQCNRYLSYVGPTAELDSMLLSLYEYNSNNSTEFSRSAVPQKSVVRTIRRVQSQPNVEDGMPGDCTAFQLVEMPIADSVPIALGYVQMSPDTLAETKRVQELVGNLSSPLLGIFLRHVLPCYPMIHKTTLLDKFSRSVFELNPSILGALYLYSLNWLSYDEEVASMVPPSPEVLEDLCSKAFDRELSCPTISTIQAGLLLLQQKINYNEVPNPSFSWNILSRVVAASHEIGLHLDPTEWDIPHWEKFLRRRLGGAVYIQDKWTALTTGRPAMINDINWTIPEFVIENDFPDLLHLNTTDEDKIAVNATTGVLLYVEMINLSKIISGMLCDIFSGQNLACSQDAESIHKKIIGDLELVKAYHLQLRYWYQGIPQRLRSNCFKKGEFSSNGNLHLSFYAADLSLFRHLLKLLAKCNSPDLATLKSYVVQASYDLWTSAVDMVLNLKPQQLQSFWYSFSKANMSLISTFGFVLLLSVDDVSMQRGILSTMEDFRWSLVLHSKSASFMKHAIYWIDHYSTKLKDHIAAIRE